MPKPNEKPAAAGPKAKELALTKDAAEVDYKAFVHLLGPGEAILAQEDRPLEYRGRRAAAWAAGEAPVTALDALLPGDAPAGALRLRVGLYDGASGARLAAGGSDHLDLPGPVVRVES